MIRVAGEVEGKRDGRSRGRRNARRREGKKGTRSPPSPAKEKEQQAERSAGEGGEREKERLVALYVVCHTVPSKEEREAEEERSGDQVFSLPRLARSREYFIARCLSIALPSSPPFYLRSARSPRADATNSAFLSRRATAPLPVPLSPPSVARCPPPPLRRVRAPRRRPLSSGCRLPSLVRRSARGAGAREGRKTAKRRRDAGRSTGAGACI